MTTCILLNLFYVLFKWNITQDIMNKVNKLFYN